jgi:hypothetical protein
MLPRLRHAPKLHEESSPIDTLDVAVRTTRHELGLSTVRIRLKYPSYLLLGLTILRLYEPLFYMIHNMSMPEGENTPGAQRGGKRWTYYFHFHMHHSIPFVSSIYLLRSATFVCLIETGLLECSHNLLEFLEVFT